MQLLKKNSFACLVLAALLMVVSQQFTCTEEQYQSFLDRFSEDRADDSVDHATRFQIYCKNLEEIENTNAQNLGFTVKEYRWMDRTDEELNQYVRIEVSPEVLMSVNKPSVNDNIRSVASTPSSVDWRTTNDVSSIKNQGTCGTCWSFTTIGLYESWMMVKGEQEYDLSEQYVLECTTAYTKNVLNQNYESTCAGGYVDFAGDLIRRNGAPNETQYPYLGYSYGTSASFPTTANGSTCSASPTIIYAGDPTVTSYNIYRNLTSAQMQTLIAEGPVGVLIYADTGLMSYSSGVYSGCPSFSSSYNLINHAVVVVGYDSSGNYIIKNSWGTSWGVSGFGTVSVSNDCAISAFVYQYASSASSGQSLVFTGQADLSGESRMMVTGFVSALMLVLVMFF